MVLVHRGSRVYYYTSSRVDGVTVREYVGSGAFAATVAEFDRLERNQRRLEREADRAEREAISAAERPLHAFSAAVDRAVSVAMTAAGFHRQGRHQWRRKRVVMKTQDKTAAKAETAEEQQAVRLLKLMEAGDPSYVEMIPKFLDDEPEFAETIGNMADAALKAILGGHLGENPLRAEAARRWVERIVKQLEGDEPSAVESMLARRIAMNWLVVSLYEFRSGREMSVGVPLAKAAFYEKRITAAHNRLLSSLRTLATVRRLPLSAVSVTVGKVTVNNAATDPAGELDISEVLAGRITSNN